MRYIISIILGILLVFVSSFTKNGNTGPIGDYVLINNIYVLAEEEMANA